MNNKAHLRLFIVSGTQPISGTSSLGITWHNYSNAIHSSPLINSKGM